jgi:aminoglycoside phosphotransferase (APT) family kinase protein
MQMLETEQLVASSVIGTKPSQATPAVEPSALVVPRNADPACAAEVGPLLSSYLERRLGLRNLSYAQPPVELPNGWEAYTYSFQLKSTALLPRGFGCPLIARIYPGPAAVPRAKHEFVVQRTMHGLNYPVAEPLLLEESCDHFGGPFWIMTNVVGPTLLAAVLHRPWLLWQAAARMARAQYQLHELPPEVLPRRAGSYLERHLDEFATIIEEFDLMGLRPGLDWLRNYQPRTVEVPRLIHLDFHPLNLILNENGQLVVLDWDEADVGDVHADIATTLTLLQCMPAGRKTAWDRLAVVVGRIFFRRWYLRICRRLRTLDKERLAYYRALAAFQRLCRYGRWLQAGAQVTGSKPSLIAHLTPDHLTTVQVYFRKWTGIVVHL